MAETTKIEWADSSWNCWIGCTKVSPACDNCYAEALMDKRMGRAQWGTGKPRMRTSAANWKLPIKWDAHPFCECAACGHRGEYRSFHHGTGAEMVCVCPGCGRDKYRLARRRVFCASLADWLDNEVPIEWLVDLLDLIRRTPNLDWILLSKRVGNFQARLERAGRAAQSHYKDDSLWQWIAGWVSRKAPANVWLGATVVSQQEAERDVPKLLATPASVWFLSVEPMLGPIDLTAVQHTVSPGVFGDAFGWHHRPNAVGDARWPGVDWVIVGGESGPKARPLHPDWARQLRDQCAAARVPFLFKQWGEWMPEVDANRAGHFSGPLHRWPPFLERSTDQHSMRVGKKAAGRLLDGVEHNGFPLANAQVHRKNCP